jgi:hypothetical protein
MKIDKEAALGMWSLRTGLLLESSWRSTASKIRDHEAEVNAEFERIMARIREGNPPEILVKLELGRKKSWKQCVLDLKPRVV